MKEQNKNHRCCFSGHRPEKLNISEDAATSLLNIAIEKSIADGYTTFICGMARGIDLWAAEIIIKKREMGENIKLICIPPFKDFEKQWSLKDKNKYKQILESADFVKFMQEKYTPDCFYIRNRFMVDHSSRLIAAYNDEPGGTKNTIVYAFSKNVKIINILNM